MEELNNTSVKEENVNVEETQQTEKTYTEKEFQETLNKAIQKRIARERKDIEARIEAERKEAEELARLTEEERQKKLFEKEKAEFKEMKAKFEERMLFDETSRQLEGKEINGKFAKFVMANNAENTFERLTEFEELIREEVEKRVNERLKGNAPKASNNNAGIVNPYLKENYSLTKQMELEMNNPTLAAQLRSAVNK